MIGFFLAAAALLVAALFFILPPLIGKRLYRGEVSHGETNLSIYRDQLRELDNDLANGTLDRQQYEIAKREIERRVLEEGGDDASVSAQAAPMWTLAIVIAVAVPLTTIGMYLGLGSPVALDATRTAAPAGAEGHELTPERIAKMVDTLKDRLRANPDDVEGWVMLAKTSQAIDRHEDAVRAYREIVRRVPPDAQLLADFADALAVAQGRSLDGEPQQLIAQALKIDPANVKALALAGTSAFNRKDYVGAVQYWRRILGIVPPDSDFAQRIQAGISEAESLAGKPVATARPAVAAAKPQAAAGVRIAGRVELDSAVAKSVGPGDTVFVFARAAEGPRMPLAVLRLSAKDLPTSFELTEAMAMAPGMSIASFSDLVVGARVSKSGSATPQPGDWESVPVSARPGSSGLSIVVSRLVR
jgi:cytochrome c-type biogenesis protein CcmH